MLRQTAMESAKWKKVSRIFNAALEIDDARRIAFVEEECDGDAGLKAEVEALIFAHEGFDSFIDSPAAGFAHNDEGNSQQKLSSGESIGHFRILAFIGKGGMGEVYLCEDERLDRRVALKLLPEEFKDDLELVRRFQQEARAASALSHPNIITVFDVDFSKEHPFIATEFINGETLRRKLGAGAIPLKNALEIASQIASALGAAHKTGIIHRDIKPENIMIRQEDGLVKILDFGLAKPAVKFGGADSEANTFITAPGAVFGTLAYMSPEQARGEAVGPGTDIWSFGVVLYEMATGEKPFKGKTPGHLLVKIMDEPPALEILPLEIREVVRRSLEKKAEDRYRSFDEVIPLLENSRQEISLRDFKPGIHRQNPFKSRIFAAAILALAMAAIIAAYLLSISPAPEPFENASLTRLTTSGSERLAAISPDGKYVAHVSEKDGRQSLNIRQASSPNSREIAAPADSQFLGLAFSPDGEDLYYSVLYGEKPATALYRVPSLGGESRKILEGIDGKVSFSPDGKRFAFARNEVGALSSIQIAFSDGSGQPEQLAELKIPDFFHGAPAWSPDGKMIAISAASAIGAAEYKITVFDAVTKRQTDHAKGQWTYIGDLAWLPDSGGMLLTGRTRDGQPNQLWSFSLASGESRRITNDLNEYSGVSISADGRAVVSVRLDEKANLWAADIAPGRALQETSFRRLSSSDEARDGTNSITQFADGKIVYAFPSAEGDAIGIMDASGLNPRQLVTTQGFISAISASQNGRLVYALKEKQILFWLLDLNDGSRSEIAKDEDAKFQFFPNIAPSGEWLVYNAVTANSGNFDLRRKSLQASAAPQKLTDKSAGLARISPDEKHIAFNYLGSESGSSWRVGVMPSGGGDIKPLGIFGNPSTLFEWSGDAKGIMGIKTENGISDIWNYPIDGSPPEKITSFSKGKIFNLDVSPDGKRLVVSRGSSNSDVVAIRKP